MLNDSLMNGLLNDVLLNGLLNDSLLNGLLNDSLMNGLLNECLILSDSGEDFDLATVNPFPSTTSLSKPMLLTIPTFTQPLIFPFVIPTNNQTLPTDVYKR